eukprot:1158379-Pelagomonas_calceolata.AAC.9
MEGHAFRGQPLRVHGGLPMESFQKPRVPLETRHDLTNKPALLCPCSCSSSAHLMHGMMRT